MIRHRFARYRQQLIAIVCLVPLLSGCLPLGQPVVADRSPVLKPLPTAKPVPPSVRVYTVRKGDTLYSIAWRFELNYQGLARANGINEPFVIQPGQRVRLVSQLPRGSRATQPRVIGKPAQPVGKVSKSKPKRTSSSTLPPRSQAPATTVALGPKGWVWPISGKPSAEFGKTNKGMDFAVPGKRGSLAKVKATSAGEVVYAGNGIGGFERLIIIKHSPRLLSAYSFDGNVLVAEQQRVKAGGTVADIKTRDRKNQSLHFELRRDGEPINPRSVLK